MVEVSKFVFIPEVKMKRLFFQIITLAIGLVLGIGSIQATPGDLDPTFNPGGTLLPHIPGLITTSSVSSVDLNSANAIAIDPNSKKIIVGGVGLDFNLNRQVFVLARYNSDGSLDTSFGNGGLVKTDFGSDVESASINGIAIHPPTDPNAGKIVVVGTVLAFINGIGTIVQNFALVRYLSNGTLDTGFGSVGKVFTFFGTGFQGANAIAIYPPGTFNAGKIVAAGFGSGAFFDTGNFVLARYTPNGTLDTTFGGTGKVVSSDPGSANAVAIQSNERILVAGDSGSDFLVERYCPGGFLDNFGCSKGELFGGFGSGGKVFTNFGSGLNSSSDSARAIAVYPPTSVNNAGKIVVAGFSNANPTFNNDFAVARYKANGAPDTTFGAFQDGKALINFGPSSDDVANAVAIQFDDKIVMAGVTSPTPGGNRNFALARVDVHGIPDLTFGAFGRVTTNFTPPSNTLFHEDSQANALTIDANGRFVVAGEGGFGGFDLARYQGHCGNGTVDTDAGEECDNGSFCADGTTPCQSPDDCVGNGDGSCAPRDSDTCTHICKFEIEGSGIKTPNAGCGNLVNTSLNDKNGTAKPFMMSFLLIGLLGLPIVLMRFRRSA
jgi:uncharacterized delta-60 repeat protein